MSRGVRIRLVAFVVLSAVGITSITASYLGMVDKVTGREMVVTASLPGSGGLFEGSEVTYRGVKIGSVGQVLVSELDGPEQLLVTYPVLIAGGPTGSTADGFGHVNLRFDYSVPPCTEGYVLPQE